MTLTKSTPQMLDSVGWKFNTVADMKAHDRLIVGDLVETLGYYVAGDGGGAEYIIEAASSPDGYLDHLLDSGLQASLQYSTHMKAEWAGVVLNAGVAANRRAEWQAAFYRIADLSNGSDELAVSFSCDTNFNTDGTLHMSQTDGSTCIVDVQNNARILAIGGGGFEDQFDISIDAYDRSDRALKDPRTDITHTALWGGSAYVNPADLRPLPLINMRVKTSTVHIGALDCSFWCSGIRFRGCVSTNVYLKELFKHRTYGLLTTEVSNNALKVHDAVVKQWPIADDGSDYSTRVHTGGAANMSNYTGDCQVSAHRDWKILGGFYGWSRSSNLLLNNTPDVDDPAGTGSVGQDCYWDGLATDSSGPLSNYLTASAGCSDHTHVDIHVMQGLGSGAATPRWDRLDEGGPVSYECWHKGLPAFIIGADIDASTIQLYGTGIQFLKGSYITAGQNKVPDLTGADGDKVITVFPPIRVYANGDNGIEDLLVDDLWKASIGVYPRSGVSSFTGDYSEWNSRNRHATGSYTGAVQFRENPFMVTSAGSRTTIDGYMTGFAGACRIGLNGFAAQGDQWIVAEDGTYGGQALSRGEIVTALVNNPSTTWSSGDWAVGTYSSVPTISNNITASLVHRKEVLFSHNTSNVAERIHSPGGELSYRKTIGADYWDEAFDGTTVEDSGSKSGFTRKIAGHLEVDGNIRSGVSDGALQFSEISAGNDELLLNQSAGTSPANPNTIILRKTGDDRYGQLVSVPASALATGTAGQWSYDASFLYICVATNTWLKTAIATW